MHRAKIVVLGNAKGGCGKSTTAMHLAIRLLHVQQKVALLDLDARQQTLAKYVRNRQETVIRRKITLPMPSLAVAQLEKLESQSLSHQQAHLDDLLAPLIFDHDIVIVDCPGSDVPWARLVYTYADVLLTPINDSFVDLDLLAEVHPDTYEVLAPGWFSDMIWELRKQRYARDGHALDWVVLRHRLSHADTRNRRHMEKILHQLGGSLGFRVLQGLGDRVIYRELFLRGLTLSDVGKRGLGLGLTMSHVAAHQELRDLVSQLHLLQPPLGKGQAAKQSA